MVFVYKISIAKIETTFLELWVWWALWWITDGTG